MIQQNTGASLVDLGDGVACLEFHSQNNAIGPDILAMIEQSVGIVERDFRGMVIANEGRNFCVGANLMLMLMAAQEGDWDEIDLSVRMFHKAMLTLRYSAVPVVAAPHRMTLGGGVEVCLASSRVLPSAETYFGLVEVGVGLIPAGVGAKKRPFACPSRSPQMRIWRRISRGCSRPLARPKSQPAVTTPWLWVGCVRRIG
ncbi:hypothetical protein GCM10025858_00940 [Alicyclobacillus sacchari]|nr:hypothetical protein GCM10025858_00940 [Alicyclobacillus sacchari]